MNGRFTIYHLGLLAALLASCGQKSDIQEGRASFGSARQQGQAEVQAPTENETSDSESVSNENSKAEESPIVSDEPPVYVEAPAPLSPPALVEETPPDAAVPPVAIGGAYLTCSIAANELQLACQVKDAQDKALTFPNSDEIEFAYLPFASIREVPATFTALNTVQSGSYFYVDNKSNQRGLIIFKYKAGESVESLNFALGTLYAPSTENERQALAVNRFPAYLMSFDQNPNGRLFGDGDFSNENDSALTLRSPNRGKASSFASTVEITGLPSRGDLLLKDVCGLQTGSTSVVIRGPAPFKTIRIFLVPDSPNLLLVQNLIFPATGIYRVQLEHTAKTMPGDSLDDFTFGNITLGVGEFTGNRPTLQIIP